MGKNHFHESSLRFKRPINLQRHWNHAGVAEEDE